MARIFITGSADGLGHLAAKALMQKVRLTRYLPAAGNTAVQEKFLALCKQITGVQLQ